MTKLGKRSTIHDIRLRMTLAFLLLGAVFLLPACYTILKHPAVPAYESDSSERTRCNECHTQDDLWRYHHPDDYGFPRMGYYEDPWLYYYEIPWWYDSYWFYDEGNDPATVPLHRRSLRPKGDKGSTTRIRGRFIKPPAAGKTGTGETKTEMKKDKKKNENKKTKKRSLRVKGKKHKKDKKKKKNR